MKKIVKILAQAYFNICSKGASAFTPCKNKMLMQAASVFLLLLKKKAARISSHYYRIYELREFTHTNWELQLVKLFLTWQILVSQDKRCIKFH